jgi:hypothetical protein
MVYRIGNPSDLAHLPTINEDTKKLLQRHARVLADYYGQDRNILENDGGYLIFATPGTTAEELKAYFNVSGHTPEYVCRYGDLCEAFFVLTNDFTIVIIMSILDAPSEILDEID